MSSLPKTLRPRKQPFSLRICFHVRKSIVNHRFDRHTNAREFVIKVLPIFQFSEVVRKQEEFGKGLEGGPWGEIIWLYIFSFGKGSKRGRRPLQLCHEPGGPPERPWRCMLPLSSGRPATLPRHARRPAGSPPPAGFGPFPAGAEHACGRCDVDQAAEGLGTRGFGVKFLAPPARAMTRLGVFGGQCWAGSSQRVSASGSQDSRMQCGKRERGRVGRCSPGHQG